MDVIVAGLVTAAIFKGVSLYFLSKNQHKKVKVGVVTGLKIYPMKSVGGIKLDEFVCTTSGPKHGNIRDRHWMIIKSDGMYEGAFTDPTINLMKCEQKGDDIEITAPNMAPLRLPITPKTCHRRVIKAVVGKETIATVDCGEEAATWIQTFLKKPGHRIVYAAPSLPKRNTKNHTRIKIREADAEGEMAFASKSPFLLVNEASLEDLNSRLDVPVSIENFRGSIRVAAKEPFQEETWKDVYINDVKMNFVTPCERCTQITIHPGASQNDPKFQPLVTLNKYRTRRDYDRGCFGALLAAEKEGTIHVGDEVYAVIDETLAMSK